MKVLLIDDEEDFCELVKANLEETGEFEVITTTDPQQGLTLAKKELPNIILLDIVMPGMDGSTLAGRLKEDPLTADIPIIFLTAIVTQSEIGSEGREISGRHFFAKPVETQALVRYIKKVLGKS
ncbi:MAG: hypothetical protein B6D53_04000 [Candidatus Omnitrophica bacterium 4484_49]|nr:response regulator [Candidatus Omnitrophota bacterium]OQX82682.1 MAG: hypothetical protein B6D53_04000 [Candidatus Omnitrophica bacterium 4484_49]